MVEDIKRVLREKGKVELELNDGQMVDIRREDGDQYESRMKGFTGRGQLDVVVDEVIRYINKKYLVVREIKQ